MGFRLEKAVETVGKLTPLLAGSSTLRRHFLSMIHQESGIAKGTAQRAFYGLPKSLVPLARRSWGNVVSAVLAGGAA
jgi:hypothetical protein